MQTQNSPSKLSVYLTLFLAFGVPVILFWLAKTTTPLWYVVFALYLFAAFVFWARDEGKSWEVILRMVGAGISGPIAVVMAIILILGMLFVILMLLSALIGV